MLEDQVGDGDNDNEEDEEGGKVVRGCAGTRQTTDWFPDCVVDRDGGSDGGSDESPSEENRSPDGLELFRCDTATSLAGLFGWLQACISIAGWTEFSREGGEW